MRPSYYGYAVALVLATTSVCFVSSAWADAGTLNGRAKDVVVLPTLETANSSRSHMPTAQIVRYGPSRRPTALVNPVERDGTFHHESAITFTAVGKLAQVFLEDRAATATHGNAPDRDLRPSQGAAPSVQLRPSNSMSPSDLDRAEALIKLGDISGARLLLRRPADLGDARALFLLGRTYDPKYLPAKRYGIQSDEAQATELYRRAAGASGQPEKAIPALRPPLPREADPQKDLSGAISTLEGKHNANTPTKEEGSVAAKILSLLRATNVSGSDPHPMPAEALALEPALSEVYYAKRPDGEIELFDGSTGLSLGPLVAK